MTNDWTFFRRVAESEIHNFSALEQKTAEDGKIVVSGSDISLIFPNWIKGKENVLFIGPHDDDIQLGAGLLIQAVAAYGGIAYFLIVSDGRQGYFKREDKELIYNKRCSETIKGAKILGVTEDRITRLDLPDGSVTHYNCVTTPDGMPGLHSLLTKVIREIEATRIIVPTYNDTHPDHKYTFESTNIARFHSVGEIWEELGQSTRVKTVIESFVYCGGKEPQDLALRCSRNFLNKKIKAIEAFNSQRQIKDLVDRLKADGPYETFSTVPPPDYSAKVAYQRLFLGKKLNT